MIDFLDDANEYMCKNRTARSDFPASCCCVKFEIIIYYQSYLFLCQIIPKILKISVCVSNYIEDICSCVKLYRSYLFMCQI